MKKLELSKAQRDLIRKWGLRYGPNLQSAATLVKDLLLSAEDIEEIELDLGERQTIEFFFAISKKVNRDYFGLPKEIRELFHSYQAALRTLTVARKRGKPKTRFDRFYLKLFSEHKTKTLRELRKIVLKEDAKPPDAKQTSRTQSKPAKRRRRRGRLRSTKQSLPLHIGRGF